jgi:hypothetical protein
MRKHPTEHASVAHTNPTLDPHTYMEVMSRHDAAKWEMACNTERHVFESMRVFKVIPHLANRKVVGSKWVFKIKCGPDGQILKYKSCIVAQGFTQIEGLDYNETFAPIIKFASIWAILR